MSSVASSIRQTPRRGVSVPGWVWLVGLFGLLVVVQGALRKWVFPGLSAPLYVAKDVVLVGALVLFGQRYGYRLATPLRRTLLPALWGGFAFVVCLQAFNFNIPSVSVGLLGIRSYLLYSSLLIILPAALEHVDRHERLVTILVLGVVVPVLVLGIYQYFQPMDAWVNDYLAEEMENAAVMGHPRIAGTFSYLGGMASFLTFSAFLGVGVLVAGARHDHNWYKGLGGGLLLLAMIVAPMNGSRGVVYGLALPLPFVLYVVAKRRTLIALLGTVVVVGAIGGAVALESDWATTGWETITYRIETASDQDTRIQTMLLDPVRKVPVGGLLGYGAGATHQAATALSETGRVQIEGVYYEGELGRVLIELGVVGALFFLALKVWLAWMAWRAMRRARTAWEDLLSILSFCVLFLNAWVGMIAFNHIAGAIYWVCAGCAAWVWSRQELEIRALREQERASQVVRGGGNA